MTEELSKQQEYEKVNKNDDDIHANRHAAGGYGCLCTE